MVTLNNNDRDHEVIYRLTIPDHMGYEMLSNFILQPCLET